MLFSPFFLSFIPFIEATQVPFGTDSAKARPLLPSRNPTKSFWLSSPGANPFALEGSEGRLTPDADVCIIGSGLTGVSAAWHLQHYLKNHGDKLKVTILEAREFCSGATGRNGGHMKPFVFEGFGARQRLYSTAEAVKSALIETYTSDSIVRFLNDRNLTSQVDLYDGGVVTLVSTRKEEEAVRADITAASEAGLDVSGVRWLENDELVERYKLDARFNYTAVEARSHNLWPCKVVTEFYKDSTSESSSSHSNISISLHTKTPVTSISRLAPTASTCDARYRHRPRNVAPQSPRMPALSTESPHLKRRWALHTPRGPVTCAFVVHATNGYAGHLLPFLKGHTDTQMSSFIPRISSNETSGNSPTGAVDDFGITPTRGQVILQRSKVHLSAFPWLNAWSGGGEHTEYFFPRFQHITSPDTESPLIVLGGGRQHGTNYESGISDDSQVNLKVGQGLRAYLGSLFNGLFNSGQGTDDVEMEWTGIMGYTKMGDPYVGPVLPPSAANHHGFDNEENEFSGQYIAAGYTGHGMVRAYACAEAVASMITSKITQSKWDAPHWLPLRYLTWNRGPPI